MSYKIDEESYLEVNDDNNQFDYDNISTEWEKIKYNDRYDNINELYNVNNKWNLIKVLQNEKVHNEFDDLLLHKNIKDIEGCILVYLENIIQFVTLFKNSNKQFNIIQLSSYVEKVHDMINGQHNLNKNYLVELREILNCFNKEKLTIKNVDGNEEIVDVEEVGSERSNENAVNDGQNEIYTLDCKKCDEDC